MPDLSTSLAFRGRTAAGGVAEPPQQDLSGGSYVDDFGSDTTSSYMGYDGTTRDDSILTHNVSVVDATATGGPRMWLPVTGLTAANRYVFGWDRTDGNATSVSTGFESTDPGDSGTTNFNNDGGTTADGAVEHEFVPGATEGYIGFRSASNTTITTDDWFIYEQSYQSSIGGQGFDGTDELQIASSTLGMSDGVAILFHFIFDCDETNATNDRFLVQHSTGKTNLRIQDVSSTQGYIRWRFESVSGAGSGVIWEGRTGSTYNDGTVYEAFLSLDNDGTTPHKRFYIGPLGGAIVSDAVDITTTAYGNGLAVDHTTGGNWNIGSAAGGGTPRWNDGIYKMSWTNGSAAGSLLDITKAVDRERIRRESGVAWYVNYEGNDWATTGNEGTGGNFTITGTLDAIAS